MTLSLDYKNGLMIVTVFIVLVLGNILQVYSVSDHQNHGAHNLTQNQLDSNLNEHDMLINKSPELYAEQIFESCQNVSDVNNIDNNHCPMMALDELNKTTTNRQLVLATFSELVRLYDETNYSCHHDGHHLGMWLYNYTGDTNESLKYATIHCGGSVYHGIFQSYFEGEQFSNTNVDKGQIAITNLCPVGQENINWLHERDCIHGIGHGLIKLYDYDTVAAVDRCNEFVPIWTKSACSRGVFMENTEYFFETGKGDFDPNDNYSPCNTTVEKFASQCYYYYPAYYLVKNSLSLDYNLSDAFSNCDNISPAKFAKFCYQGMGRLLETAAYTNPELSIAACYVGNQTIYHKDCLLGTLKTIMKGDATTEVGFNYCSHTNLDFKAACYEIVGLWIQEFLSTTKEELESECAKAPDSDYIITCINANQKLDTDVPIFEPV